MKVVHIITSLNNGGAEAVLFRLCSFDNKNEHVVISMMDEGKYGVLLKGIGLEVHCLNMSQGRISLSGMFKLFKLIRLLKPDIIQTWMYHANLLGSVAVMLLGMKNIVWGIHHTVLDSEHSKSSTILISNICSKLSHFIPSKIVCCAQKAVDVHSKAGYAEKKLIVINNGYDLSKFYVNNSFREKIRAELGVGDNVPLIGLVSRFDPLKDHENLLLALSRVKLSGVTFKFCLAGSGLNYQNDKLMQWITENDLYDQVILLDQRDDIPMLMNALDLHVLSSMSEAFPNVICESMACGTPCVSTIVGDAELIIGSTGWLVPVKDFGALAGAIMVALNEFKIDKIHWAMRQNECRQRIVTNFDIGIMVEKYQSVWKKVGNK